MSVKVSVIVPTYNTDPTRLDLLVRSLREQTMSAEEYEVIFVDDGSTSEIYSKIQGLTRRYERFSSTQIPNSGWACRPRNVGTLMARGDYVLFMDHDDVVFPEGLQRSYDYGRQHSADVVNHKEIRTTGWAWSWGRFLADDPEAHRKGVSCLIPMTPHKLYRRSFLLEHDITFDEGARVLWEDVYFNSRVWAHEPRVAVLSNYPVYHWANTGENTSSTFSRDPHERWGQLNKLLRFFHETLPAGKDQDYLVDHWYKSRVLALIGGALEKKSDERIATELGLARQTATELVSDAIKDRLTGVDRARQTIIDKGDVAVARAFAQSQTGVDAWSHTTDVWWSGSALNIAARTTLLGGTGEPLDLIETDRGVERVIDRPFADLFGANDCVLTGAVSKASYLLSLKARATRESWCLPGRGKVELEETAGGGMSHLHGDIIGGVDLLTAAFGRPLDSQAWEVGARLTAVGKTSHRGLVVGQPDGLSSGALISGRTAVAYQNKSGTLSVDIGSTVKSVVSTVALTRSSAQVDRQHGRIDIVIQLPGLHVFGATDIPGYISLQPGVLDGEKWKVYSEPAARLDARLIGDEQGARVVAWSDWIAPGYYRVSTNFEAREQATDLVINTILDSASSSAVHDARQSSGQ